MPWRKGNKLRLVPEAQASEPVKEQFEAVKAALGVPYVGTIFQAYAVYPEFLPLAVEALRAMSAYHQFFVLGERLRADAYTRVHNYFKIRRLENASESDRQELLAVADLQQYTTPLELLFVSALLQSFEGPVGCARGNKQEKPEYAAFNIKPRFIGEEDAGTGIRKRYDEVKRVLGMPFVPDTFKAFARWPDFFTDYWDVARSVAQSPLFQEYTFRLHENVWSRTAELSEPLELAPAQLAEAGITDEDIASIVRITDMFCNSFPAITLLTAVAKIGLEGGNGRELQPQTGRQESAA